ncbi:NB-ARC domain-containing protein [Calothrix sp. NIES-2098]|uniref:NB-ARC domain-containing protein n=1 Tax=Calothrix sp. NIES-2098 TaxID=1954171 RepID=UPI000BBC3B0A
MDFEPKLSTVNAALFERFGRYLNDVETAILIGSLQRQTYEKIAEDSGYSESYVRRDVGPKLWKMLSEALGEQVSKTNFQTALERRLLLLKSEEKEAQSIPLTPNSHSKTELFSSSAQDWGEAVDVSFFYGRQCELATLKQWIVQDKCRLIALLGMGGIGKSACSVKLAQLLQAEFEFIIWRSLSNAPPLETLLTDLVLFLSNQQSTKTDIGQLIHYLRSARCLVILDNLETILDAEQAGQYIPGYEGYGELLRVVGETSHKSCVMLTSREKPAEIATFEGVELAVRTLKLQGSKEAAIALLQAKGLAGSPREKQVLCERYGNNLLALKIIATTIQDLFDNSIEDFLKQDTMVFNGIRRLLEQQFNRLSTLEQTVMYRLAINREWTTIDRLQKDILPTVSRARLLEALEALNGRSLIEKKSSSYTQQPLVMEYVNEKLVEQIATEIALKKLSLLFAHAFKMGGSILGSSSLKAALDLNWNEPKQRNLALSIVLGVLEQAETRTQQSKS